jgi:hypothetical protein
LLPVGTHLHPHVSAEDRPHAVLSLDQSINRLHLEDMPEDVHLWILDNYFPDTRIWREGESIVCQIEEHLYTKYWEHKFSAYTFADAMERAVRRLAFKADTPRESRPLTYYRELRQTKKGRKTPLVDVHSRA